MTSLLPQNEDGSDMEGVKVESGNRLRLDLEHPVEIGEEVIDHLVFRQADGREFELLPVEGLEGAKMKLLLEMAANMTGSHYPVLLKMRPSDLRRVTRVVAHFFT